MPNEITAQVSLQVSKNNASLQASASGSFTLTGSRMIKLVQSVGTSSEAVGPLTDITSAGFLYIKNLDATNYVEISVDTTFGATTTFAKLLAGQFMLLPAKLTTYFARANTAACECEVAAVEL